MAARTDRSAKVTLPSDNEVMITREFDAPRRLVCRAWTSPELVRRWWPAGRGEMMVAEIDLRVGGVWRYAMVTHEGSREVAFHGEYRELVEDRLIVSTEVYEAMPDAEALDTITLTDTPAGGTLLTLLVRHSCREHRDAHVNSGMEDGLQEALALLEQTARSLR